MPELDEFRQADGEIDWAAYKRAQVQDGEICRTCGGYSIVRLLNGPPGRPRECAACKKMASVGEEVSHDGRIRCPRCLSIRSAEELEVYPTELGNHHVDVWCPDCEGDFMVEVRMSWEFVSPPQETP